MFLVYLMYLSSILQVSSATQNKNSIDTVTVLFGDSERKERWSKYEDELVKARRDMNSLIPKEMKERPDEYVPALIDHFEICVGNIQKHFKGKARYIRLLALADVFEDFLHVYTLPLIKKQHYAGLFQYAHVQKQIGRASCRERV